MRRSSNVELQVGGGDATNSQEDNNAKPSSRAVPGRPRRKRSTNVSGRKRRFCYRLYVKWVEGTVLSMSSLFFAVLLWYLLGVVSIGTSKYLLMKHEGDHLGRVPPLFLTLQQQVIGSILLRFLLQIQFLGLSQGLQPWPMVTEKDHTRHTFFLKRPRSWLDVINDYQPSLVLAAAYFCLGFLATNFGFSGSPASFVETIKAAEPITSATVAVLWGIEILSQEEVMSLGVIVAGVLLSTLGNGGEASTGISLGASLLACVIVMASNLCFSFRGLYQKLFRATPQGTLEAMDDMNLQYRMQQIGALLMSLPVLFLEVPSILSTIWRLSMHHSLFQSGLIWRYVSLSLINGCAFAGYNLASTFILSRISVVHHAALNCLRRMFAIIVTSFLFGVPITFIGAMGILCSFIGFMGFSHYKVQRQKLPRPVSSLLPISAVK
jgi:drug/metabolite transporter (DMT)-like permease